MRQKLSDTPVIVNKSGCPEIELLANSIDTTTMGREYIVNELIAAGFRSVKSVVSKSVPEMMCVCPYEIRELVPKLHAYAVSLQQMGF